MNRLRRVAFTFALLFASACATASASDLDSHALFDRAAGEVGHREYAGACRDLVHAISLEGGILRVHPRSAQVPTLEQANAAVPVARAFAGQHEYAAACAFAYWGALLWEARGDQASALLLSREAEGYAKAAGLEPAGAAAEPRVTRTQTAPAAGGARAVAAAPAVPGATVSAAFVQSLKPGTAVVTGDGIANWGAFEQGYGCTYTGFVGPAASVSGPYQMSPYGVTQSSLQSVWLTSPSSYRVAGAHPGTGSFTFDRRFPGPLDPSFHGILVFTSGPLQGHTAIIADNPVHKNKALYFPLDWYATNGKPDTFDPRSGTSCMTQAKA